MKASPRSPQCRRSRASAASVTPIAQIEVDPEEGRAIAVRGDRADPLFGGYTCMKGRELPAQTYHPERLTSSVKRQANGSFTAMGSEAALDEIAVRLEQIRTQHGARAIATC